MKEYKLSNTQWTTLWLSKYPQWQFNIPTMDDQNIMQKEYMARVKIFIEKFPDLYYREVENQEYYAIITYHDDKDLTFFLLQL